MKTHDCISGFSFHGNFSHNLTNIISRNVIIIKASVNTAVLVTVIIPKAAERPIIPVKATMAEEFIAALSSSKMPIPIAI